MSVDIFRIQNPFVLRQPVFLDLAQRAFGARADLFPSPDEVLAWLEQNVADPENALWVAVGQDSTLGGLMVATIKTSVFSHLPWILYLFSDHWSMTVELAKKCRKRRVNLNK